ncbi:hypothetical protein [Streptomyces sp. NPDC096032]|uniref:hypothetical protein n=1 Tax=Streptomyces sp. NPDC096032 TaxID=3366070 RepID=UPI0037FCA8D4
MLRHLPRGHRRVDERPDHRRPPVGQELWDAPNTAGFHQEYQQATSYVGDAMNDRASSIAML